VVGRDYGGSTLELKGLPRWDTSNQRAVSYWVEREGSRRPRFSWRDMWIVDSLFGLYRRSSLRRRRVIVPFTVPLRLALRPFVHHVRLSGYQMALDLADNASFKYWVDREKYEADLVQSFLQVLSRNPGSYVLDVGANYGPYTLACAALGRHGLVSRIFAFEPDDRPFRALLRSVSTNHFGDFVEVHQAIVGGQEGTAPLFKSYRSSATNRTFATVSTTIGFTRTAEIKTVVLNSFLAQRLRVEEARLLVKIDVEGNEERVLRGLTDSLARCSGFLLLFEYHPHAIREVGLDPLAVGRLVLALDLEFLAEGRPDGLRRISGPAELEDRMRELEGSTDARFVGQPSNFLVARGLDLGSLGRVPEI
jgi:FkbM family methyltransferase